MEHIHLLPLHLHNLSHGLSAAYMNFNIPRYSHNLSAHFFPPSQLICSFIMNPFRDCCTNFKFCCVHESFGHLICCWMRILLVGVIIKVILIREGTKFEFCFIINEFLLFSLILLIWGFGPLWVKPISLVIILSFCYFYSRTQYRVHIINQCIWLPISSSKFLHLKLFRTSYEFQIVDLAFKSILFNLEVLPIWLHQIWIDLLPSFSLFHFLH